MTLLLLFACGGASSEPVALDSPAYAAFIESCTSGKLRSMPSIGKICRCMGEGFVVGKTLPELQAAQRGEGPHAEAYEATMERCALVR